MNFNKKHILIAVGVLLLLECAIASHTMSPNREEYTKGETITVSGSSDWPVDIEILNETIAITGARVNPTDGRYEFTYQTSFLDPSGTWSIKTKSQDGEVEESVQVIIPPKGAYHLITFFSPSSGEKRRAEELEVNIEVTDSGNAVLGAQIVVYGTQGDKIKLSAAGGGRYSGTYLIPFDADIGNFELIVATQIGSGENAKGGENDISMSVIETPILFESVRPDELVLIIGEEIEFAVDLTYFNGLPVDESTEVYAKIEEDKIPFTMRSKGEYTARYTPLNIGALQGEIIAVDSAGNIGTNVISVVVGGLNEAIIRDYWPVFLIVGIAVLFVLYKAQGSLLKSFKMNRLKNKRIGCVIRLERIQDQYYKKHALSRESFEAASVGCKRELTEYDRQIHALGGQVPKPGLDKKIHKILKKGKQ